MIPRDLAHPPLPLQPSIQLRVRPAVQEETTRPPHRRGQDAKILAALQTRYIRGILRVVCVFEVRGEARLERGGDGSVVVEEGEITNFPQLGGVGVAGREGLGVDDGSHAGEDAGARLGVGGADVEFELGVLGDDLGKGAC